MSFEDRPDFFLSFDSLRYSFISSSNVLSELFDVSVCDVISYSFLFDGLSDSGVFFSSVSSFVSSVGFIGLRSDVIEKPDENSG